ncbi:MAG: ABC transporter permease [Patescibacteria group bacterium]|nr:ABC transporter permease [Patescibacteria group bacterium]
MKSSNVLIALTKANIKMYIRDKGAIFWSLFFPVMIITIFGVMDFSKMGSTNIGLVYNEDTKIYAEQLKKGFEQGSDYKFHKGALDSELTELENNDRSVVLEFNVTEDSMVQVNSYIAKQNEQSGSIITMITEKILADIALQMQHIELPFEVNKEIVNTNDLRYIDFIVPGVIAMSLMQGSMFSVIGTIVVYREKGVLKRLFATPLTKSAYLISNIITRMFMALAQIGVLLALAYIIFGIRIVGSLWLVALLASIGSLVFLAIGFMISSFAKTSESARAMIMPIQMLFMFTGGVYFERSVLPNWLFNITKPLPLTYLSDLLKDVMVHGYGLGDKSIQTGTLALTIWLVVTVALSIKTFKWNGE